MSGRHAALMCVIKHAVSLLPLHPCSFSSPYSSSPYKEEFQFHAKALDDLVFRIS